MSDYILINGELYHHGVKGMKWGKRKARYESERNAYRSAKKDLANAKSQYEHDTRQFVAYGGRTRLKNASNSERAYEKAEMRTIDAKAKYKAAKSINSEKAEFKVYRNEMAKSGVAGSAADFESGGRSTRIYDKVKAEKGKAYADRVQKSAKNKVYREFATAATVLVGTAFVTSALQRR